MGGGFMGPQGTVMTRSCSSQCSAGVCLSVWLTHKALGPRAPLTTSYFFTVPAEALATAPRLGRGGPRVVGRQCRPTWTTARCPSCRARCAAQCCSWRSNVFRPRCRVLALRPAPTEHYSVTPQECLCVATAGRPRRISSACHADTCSILPLHAGTLAASHKIHSQLRHFPLAAHMWPEFYSPAAGWKVHAHMAWFSWRWLPKCRAPGRRSLEGKATCAARAAACSSATAVLAAPARTPIRLHGCAHPFAVIMRCLSQVEWERRLVTGSHH